MACEKGSATHGVSIGKKEHLKMENSHAIFHPNKSLTMTWETEMKFIYFRCILLSPNDEVVVACLPHFSSSGTTTKNDCIFSPCFTFQWKLVQETYKETNCQLLLFRLVFLLVIVSQAVNRNESTFDSQYEQTHSCIQFLSLVVAFPLFIVPPVIWNNQAVFSHSTSPRREI